MGEGKGQEGMGKERRGGVRAWTFFINISPWALPQTPLGELTALL